MKIFSILKRGSKENKELVKLDNVSLIEKETKKEFLRVISENAYDEKNLTKIGEATKVNMILQQLPLAANIIQSQEMKGAYKVVFPEGVTGTLMKYKNGLLGTPVIGENGKPIAHAGLKALEASNVLQPVMIFSAMSVITGQYFMARIDKSLSAISSDVKEIIELIYDGREADTDSIYDYYASIKNNMATIIDNKESKIADLTNIKNNNNKLNSNIKFYTKSIKRKFKEFDDIDKGVTLTTKRLDKIEKLNAEIERLTNQQLLCYELFCIGKILEMKIAEVYSENYYNNIINEFEVLREEIRSNIGDTITLSKIYINKINNGVFLRKEKILNGLENLGDRCAEKGLKLNNNSNNLIENVKMFALESSKETEFYVIGNELYARAGV